MTEELNESPRLTVVESQSLDQTRRTIARRLGESYRDAVHVTVSRAIDVRALLEARAQLSDRDGSLVDVLLLAVADTLTAHPRFNATFEDETLTIYEEHNIAIAVDTEAGLLAPVIPAVSTVDVDTLAQMRRTRTDRVIAGEHTLGDLRGGTITVTNLGPLGVDTFSPIINPPQVAIIGLNRIRDRATPTGDGAVEFVREMTIDLTFDHRVIDGADAARFLETLDSHLANAEGYV